jgi:hypothetical protein
MIINEFTRLTQWTSKTTGKVTKVNESLVTLQCDKCGKEHSRTKKHFNKMLKSAYFDIHYCNNCWASVQNNIPERKEKNRQSQLNRFSDPAEIEKLRIACKGNNAGSKNAMKRPSVRAKVSETRSKLMEDPAFRAKFKQGSIDAWARGAYDHVETQGRTVWHEYKHSDGTVYKVQGRYELKFIQWLDENDLTFECHQGRIPYISDDGLTHNYYPDFYVHEWGCYVDPKATHWYNIQYRKFELLKEQSPEVEIRILTEDKLRKLGIKL